MDTAPNICTSFSDMYTPNFATPFKGRYPESIMKPMLRHTWPFTVNYFHGLHNNSISSDRSDRTGHNYKGDSARCLQWDRVAWRADAPLCTTLNCLITLYLPCAILRVNTSSIILMRLRSYYVQVCNLTEHSCLKCCVKIGKLSQETPDTPRKSTG